VRILIQGPKQELVKILQLLVLTTRCRIYVRTRSNIREVKKFSDVLSNVVDEVVVEVF